MNKVYESSQLLNINLAESGEKYGISFRHETVFHIIPVNLEAKLNEWSPKWSKTVAIINYMEGKKVLLEFQFLGTENKETIAKIITREINTIIWTIAVNSDGTTSLESAKFGKC